MIIALIAAYLVGIVIGYVVSLWLFYMEYGTACDESEYLFSALIAVLWPLALPVFAIWFGIFWAGEATIDLFEKWHRRPNVMSTPTTPLCSNDDLPD
jgi:hypothetical protein